MFHSCWQKEKKRVEQVKNRIQLQIILTNGRDLATQEKVIKVNILLVENQYRRKEEEEEKIGIGY